jgi:hypothetical protein
MTEHSKAEEQKRKDNDRAFLLRMVAVTIVLCGISTCVDVTWTWIEKTYPHHDAAADRDVLSDASSLATIGVWNGSLVYVYQDASGREPTGFRIASHQPAFQAICFGRVWMHGIEFGISIFGIIPCAILGIYASRSLWRRRYTHTHRIFF